MVVIVWQLDLQLPMQSVPITTDVVNTNFDQGEVYNIMNRYITNLRTPTMKLETSLKWGKYEE